MRPTPIPFLDVIATTGTVVATVAVVAVVVIVILLTLRARRAGDPAGEPPRIGETILVAISRPRSATHLIDLAEAVAVTDRGRLIAMKVLTEGAGDEERAAAELLLQQTAVACADAGCDAEEVLRVAASVPDGILHALVERDATLMLCGWPSVERGGQRLGHPVDRIVADSPVPVIVGRLDGHEWQRVVLAGAHRSDPSVPASGLAAEVARRIAARQDLRLEREPDPVVDPAALVVRGVAPDAAALSAALAETGEAGDVLIVLSHGPMAEVRRALLPSAEQLEHGPNRSGEG